MCRHSNDKPFYSTIAIAFKGNSVDQLLYQYILYCFKYITITFIISSYPITAIYYIFVVVNVLYQCFKEMKSMSFSSPAIAKRREVSG